MASDRRTRTAVVGSGIAGLTAAHLLARTDRVALFESEPRLGGHAHTHLVPGASGPVAVDSGFIVHNDRTYPLLTRLFAELGVATRDTEMSMSISDPATGIEYAGGKGLGGFLARPRQLLRTDYLEVLASARRFHRLASAFLADSDDLDSTTFGDFLAAHSFSPRFRELYAVPLVSCVWSTGRADALGYPARYLFRFLAHHGMLSVGDSPQWRTVVGGSARYVEAIAQEIPDVRRGAKVTAIARHPDGATIWHSGDCEDFDRVVIATHADTALGLLTDASPAEKEVLGAFRYTINHTVLHRDPRLLPRAPRARASWNYLVAPPGSSRPPVVTYWMNKLQGLDPADPLLVTLNAPEAIAPDLIIAQMTYTHPVYDLPAIAAHRRLPEITSGTTAYAGAYHGWGFHEDGCRSGVAAAAAFGSAW